MKVFLVVLFVGSCILLRFVPYLPVEDRDYHPLVENKKISSVFAWSPDGNQVVYQPDENEPYEIRDLKTNGITTLSLPEGIRLRDISWFSEEELAFISNSKEETNYKVFLFNISEQRLVEIWETQSRLYQICWLPSEATFVVLADSNRFRYGNAILRYQESSGQFRPIYNEEDGIDALACSLQQGKIAVVVHNNSDRTDRLYSMEIEDTFNKDLLYEAQLNIGSLSWSPNDDWIAGSLISRNSRDIILVSPDGSTTHKLRNIPWSYAVLANVKWSPVENTLMVRHRSGWRLNATYSLALYDFTPPAASLQE